MSPIDADTLSRTAKMFADDDAVTTLDEAEQHLRGFVLQVNVGRGLAVNRSLQAALLTVVNAAARAFKGGVRVKIEEDVVLQVGWCNSQLTSAAVRQFGGVLADELDPAHPTICIGASTNAVPGKPVLRATFDGWSAGVVEGTASALPERDFFAPAGIVAGGIAVAEAFEFRRGRSPFAGRRDQGVSLWRPEVAWTSPEAIGPDDVTYAPSKCWVVGLGHLGQGYLWCLGMLGYVTPREVELMLQDDDIVTVANESTGLLLVPGSVRNEDKRRKTRVLADVLNERGFTTTITERRLRRGQGPEGAEPRLALIGVDNAATRSAVSDCGFDVVVDAGLGGGPVNYLAMQIRSFPGPRTSGQIAAWSANPEPAPDPLGLDAYGSRAAEGDVCGAIEIAGKSVAAAFVGATAGALVIAEATRALRGDHRYEVIDGTLRSLDQLGAVPTGSITGNTGFAAIQ